MRRTGIDLIGDVPWGTHFCQFYKTKQDLIDILVPYFRQGLQDNEFCMWVTSEPLDVSDAKKALNVAVPDLQDRLSKGQIEILPYDKWYTKSGEFNADEVLRGWIDKLNNALANGYQGLRLTGNTFWLEKADWDNFTNYEAKINSVIDRYRMMAVCTYSLDRCSATEVIDVVSNHQFALIKKEGLWKIIESSEHKDIESALRHERDFISAILNTAGALVVVLDREGRILRFNRACKQATGYSAEEVQGRIFWEFLIPQEDMEGVASTWKSLNAGMFPNQHKNHWLARDGSRRLIAWTNSVLISETGETQHIIGTGIDITDRKRAENALQIAHRRLALAQQSAGAGSWSWDMLTNKLEWSPELYHLFGLDPATVKADFETWRTVLHPEDYRVAEENINSAIQNHTRLYNEYRIVLPSGGIRWINAVGETVYDNNGKAVSMSGLCIDITGRKDAEEEIRQRAEEVKVANRELERFNRVAVDRELRMIELKKQVNELCVLAGKPPRYNIEFE